MCFYTKEDRDNWISMGFREQTVYRVMWQQTTKFNMAAWSIMYFIPRKVDMGTWNLDWIWHHSGLGSRSVSSGPHDDRILTATFAATKYILHGLSL